MNLKTPSSHRSLLCRLDFTPKFSTSSPRAAQGDGEWGLRSVHHTLSLLLLPPQREDSSHSSAAPAWGPSDRRQSSMNFSCLSPSHGLQLFTNVPSVGPSYGVPTFRNRLLQRGSPTGSQTLPANLFPHGFLSPQIHRSCQEPAPARPLHRVTASFRHRPALAWCPPWAEGGYLLHRGPPWAAGGQPASPGTSPKVAGESVFQHLEHLLSLLLH